MEQVKFVKDSRPFHLKIFKGYLPQVLLDPFLHTLPHLLNYDNGNTHLLASDKNFKGEVQKQLVSSIER